MRCTDADHQLFKAAFMMAYSRSNVRYRVPVRLVVLQSGLKTIFAGLGLGLGKICNQVHFQFSLCIFAVFSLGRMTCCQPVSYIQPKISVTYLIFTAELRYGFACSDSIYNVLILLVLVHTSINNSDLDLKLVNLNLT